MYLAQGMTVAFGVIVVSVPTDGEAEARPEMIEGPRLRLLGPSELQVRIVQTPTLAQFDTFVLLVGLFEALAVAFIVQTVVQQPLQTYAVVLAVVFTALFALFAILAVVYRRMMTDGASLVDYNIRGLAVQDVPEDPGEDEAGESHQFELLRNGSLEHGKRDGPPDAWSWVGPAKTTDGEIEWSSAQSRSGERSVRLASPQPFVTEGGESEDSVVAGVLSLDIGVERGDRLEAEAWVLVQEPFRETGRGATLGVIGYDADGRLVASWGPGVNEQRMTQQTDGWERMKLPIAVSDPRVRSVRVRVALCGVGECYFDDISLGLL